METETVTDLLYNNTTKNDDKTKRKRTINQNEKMRNEE